MTAYLEYNGQRIAIAGQTATVTDKPMSLLCGHRRQQMNTITTTDELDALPVGSVVMEGDNGCPVPWVGGICVMPGVWHRFPDGWYVVAGHGARVPEFDLGPLTVLYRPDQPHTVRPGVDELRSAIFHSTYPNMRWADLTDEEASDFDKATDAIVALLPGRSEAVVKAEALREVADILGHATYCQQDPDPDPDRGCVCLISILYARANLLDPEGSAK